jgi:hypothetical protein
MTIKSYKKYTKKDFLEYASAFDYSEDAQDSRLSNYKSDEEIKKDMKNNWSLKEFQKFYGFTHKDQKEGYEKFIK